MAEQITRNIEQAVTFGVSVTNLEPTDGDQVRVLVIHSTDQDLYIVVNAADGGTLPTTGRPPVRTSDCPYEYDCTPFRSVGLARQSADGTARVEVR
jgi:hypothetical protein